MDKLDRMELADIGHPRKMAQAVIDLIPSVSFPLPIEEVAFALDIFAIEDVDTTAFEGALLTNDTKSPASILVRSGLLDTRRRFTIGHELGHYLMPLHFPTAGGFRCTSEDLRAEESKHKTGKEAWEAQANAFASELLMPANEFRKRLRKAGQISIELIVTLSEVFDVSKIACGLTVLRLADDPVALVSSKDHIVRQIYPAKGFPHLSVRNGMPIPTPSVARWKDQVDGAISSCEPIDPCFWLSNYVDGTELYEQTLYQADGWCLTLLSAEVPDDEDD